MKRNVLAYLLLSIVLLTACERHYDYPHELLSVDSLCEVCPDSALLCLKAISSQMEQSPEPVRRYYQLLTVRAADKAYIPHTSDSLILQVVDYYEQSGDPSLLPTAYYYAGRVYHDMKRFPDALPFFQKALTVLEMRPDHRLMAKTNSQIGEILIDLNLEDQAMKYIDAARQNDILAGNVISLVYDLRDIANIYRTKQNYDNALQIYKEAYAKAQECNDIVMTRELEAQMADVYFILGDTLQAVSFIRKSLQHVSQSDTICIYSIATDIYIGIGKLDSAEMFAKKLLLQQSNLAREYASLSMTRIAHERGSTSSLYTNMKMYKAYNDSVIAEKNADAIAKLLVMYDYNKKEEDIRELEKQNEVKNRWIALALLLAVVLIIGIYRQWRSYKRWQARLAANLQAYQLYVETQHKMRGFPMKITTIKKDSSAGKETKQFYQHISTLRESGEPLQLSEEDWKQMAAIVEKTNPLFKFRLYQSCPKLSLHQFRVSLAIKFGLSNNEIAEATNHSPQAISSTRSRLFKKATGRNGNASDWDTFLNSI